MTITTEDITATQVRVRRRSREDAWIAGVCGGLGRYSERDPYWFRLLFVVGTILSGGIGILVYIGLWLAIPLEQPGDELEAHRPRGCVPVLAARRPAAGTAVATATGSGGSSAG